VNVISPRRVGPLALLVLAFGLAGCGGEPPTAVSGTVTFKGAPPKISGLMISFMSTAGTVVTVTVAEDGTYTASGLTGGEMRVGFSVVGKAPPNRTDRQPENLSKTDPKAQIEREKTRFKAEFGKALVKSPIPERYLDPLKSGITTSLKPGDNTLNVDIK